MTASAPWKELRLSDDLVIRYRGYDIHPADRARYDAHARKQAKRELHELLNG